MIYRSVGAFASEETYMSIFPFVLRWQSHLFFTVSTVLEERNPVIITQWKNILGNYNSNSCWFMLYYVWLRIAYAMCSQYFTMILPCLSPQLMIWLQIIFLEVISIMFISTLTQYLLICFISLEDLDQHIAINFFSSLSHIPHFPSTISTMANLPFSGLKHSMPPQTSCN